MIMEIYAAPKMSKYTTALGAYNIKSLCSYEINQHTQSRAHTHTHTHTHTPRARAHTQTRARARTHEHVVKNSY